MNYLELIALAKKRAKIKTDEKLAGFLGVDKTALCKWKYGVSKPLPQNALKLAILAGVNPDPIVAINLYESAETDELKATFHRFRKAASRPIGG